MKITLLLKICNSIFSSSSFNNFNNSIKFLVGIIIFISFSKFDSISIDFRANRYESVAVQSNLLASILKLIPVNIGLDSCCEAANDVCLIIFLNIFLFI